jgi:hypothetical protein
MKTYSYVEPGLNDEPVVVVMNEAEILMNYWPHWKERMVRKYGEDSELITDENCIDDWIALNWAVEVKLEERCKKEKCPARAQNIDRRRVI